MKMGKEALPNLDIQRPTVFDQAIADRICERLDKGENLRRFCVWPDWPTKLTVQRWAKEQPEFGVKLRKSLRKRKATASFAAKPTLPETETDCLATELLGHDDQEFDSASQYDFQYDPGDGSRVVLATHFARLLAAYKFRGEQLRSITPRQPGLSGYLDSLATRRLSGNSGEPTLSVMHPRSSKISITEPQNGSFYTSTREGAQARVREF